MITRWAADGQPHHDDRGPWVLYAEHLVAVGALAAENADKTAQHVKPIYVDAWDGMAVPYDDHVVAVEAAHAAGMREALADFLTSIDDDGPVYLRGRAAALDAARDAVRNTPTDPRWNILQIERAFLAAIDALRGTDG